MFVGDLVKGGLGLMGHAIRVEFVGKTQRTGEWAQRRGWRAR